MALDKDLADALSPDPPIKSGRAEQMGLPGQKIWVTVGNISRQYTCATVVNSASVTVVGDRVFCATAPTTVLSRTLEYSRYRPLGVPTTTGLIKYLYSTPVSIGIRKLWLGGWQEEPISIKDFAVYEDLFLLKNTGGDGYWIDYRFTDPNVLNQGIYYSLTENGVIYQHQYTQGPNDGFNSGAINPFGYSFWTRPNYGSSSGDGSYWGMLFQGVMIGGVNLGAELKRYLLPTTISPEAMVGDSPAYTTFTVNADATRGVGARNNLFDPVDRTITVYTPNTIIDTGVNYINDNLLLNGYYDCFDDNFTVIDRTAISSNALTNDVFTASVYNYDFNGIQSNSIETTVYGIPTAQRSGALLVGNPSYHPG